MRSRTFLLIPLLALLPAFAQDKKAVFPEGANPAGPFSPAIIAGGTIYVSGQVGRDSTGKAPAGFAPIAIGLALAVIHILSIPVSNTSVNPARSLGPAVFAGGVALQQVWVFWVAPIIGGVLGGLIGRWLQDE